MSVVVEMARVGTELLSLPASKLLEKFGAGSHKPGSGSAAALHGLLACKLISTVVQLTSDREKYSGVSAEMRVISEQLHSVYEPELAKLFQEDSEVFDRVIQLRRARDAVSDASERRRLNESHLAELRLATDIPVKISRTCLSVARSGLIVFDIGFRAARGDSGVAISSAVAGANGALCVAYLNLTQFRGAEVDHHATDLRRIARSITGHADGTV